MIFNKQLMIGEQLGSDINDEQINTLTVASVQGGGLVALCVTGVPELTGSGANSDIQTIMTGAECLLLVRALLKAYDAAEGEQ